VAGFFSRISATGCFSLPDRTLRLCVLKWEMEVCFAM
jgi:hypothetical protein